MNVKSLFVVLLLQAIIADGKSQGQILKTTSADSQTTFTNPLLSSGPDPWVTQRNGVYYYMNTEGNRISIYKTKNLSQLQTAEKIEVYHAPAEGLDAHSIWAPELHYINHHWYIYYTAASTPNVDSHRLFVLENANPDPTQGNWINKGQIKDKNADFFAIDATVTNIKGKNYIIWSGQPSGTNRNQHLYIAELNKPWELKTERQEISAPTYEWEKIGTPDVNEGPEILKNKKGRVFLIYSASGCWTDDYSLGMLTLKENGDPLKADNWVKSKQPIFTKKPENGAYGPGHNGFFKSPDGKEDWIIYHANSKPGQQCSNERNPRIQKFTWNKDGTPNLGEPVKINTPIKKPSGEQLSKVFSATSTSGKIIWDALTLKKVSESAPGTKYDGYARMIQLYDKSLLSVYESDGNIVATKSADLGVTWSAPITVAIKDNNGINMCVPDIIELKDHTLIACYNGRPFNIDPSRKFSIKTKRSTDGGTTWGKELLLFEADYQFENGCWEPSAIQLPSGEIQLFFANEAPYTHSNEQNISLLRSKDNGLSWTRKPETASFRATKRDGMPVAIVLNNNKEIAFAIEDNGTGDFKPYIIRNLLQENWSKTVDSASLDRNYALAEKIDKEIYAGAPYLRQLKTGKTILSYQGTEGRVNKPDFADMKVVVGNSAAKDFRDKSTPFIIPQDKHCLWNSLCILDDDTIIAVTSTNAYSKNSEIWMIKGRIKNN